MVAPGSRSCEPRLLELRFPTQGFQRALVRHVEMSRICSRENAEAVRLAECFLQCPHEKESIEPCRLSKFDENRVLRISKEPLRKGQRLGTRADALNINTNRTISARRAHNDVTRVRDAEVKSLALLRGHGKQFTVRIRLEFDAFGCGAAKCGKSEPGQRPAHNELLSTALTQEVRETRILCCREPAPILLHLGGAHFVVRR